MFGVTIMEQDNLQGLLDTAAAKLEKTEENFCYRNNFGISVIQLLSKQNGLELGISMEAYSVGPVGNYAPALTAFLTGKAEHSSRIHTEGVNTDGSQVKLSKLAYQHKFWYSHVCRQMDALLSGNEGAVNAIVYPLSKHTLRENSYKPCPTYVQYQLHQKTSTLSVVVNFRAQHLYMLAFNIQLWAFQLLQLCGKFHLNCGSVVLNCTNHHTLIEQDPKVICGQTLPWFVLPGETSDLVATIVEYYARFEPL